MGISNHSILYQRIVVRLFAICHNEIRKQCKSGQPDENRQSIKHFPVLFVLL